MHFKEQVNIKEPHLDAILDDRRQRIFLWAGKFYTHPEGRFIIF